MPEDLPDAASFPDLYYIVLDGYGRGDVLEELFGYDNRPFLAELERLGFEIVDQSRSNYVQTSLSLASSLNLTGLDTLGQVLDPTSDNKLPLARMIRFNALREFLESLGYTTVGFASGYRMSEWEDADLFLRPVQHTLNPLEGLLFETSAAIAFQDWIASEGSSTYFPGYASHRELVLYTLNELVRIPTGDEPRFVFAHIVSPHPPFVFGPKGEPVEHRFRYSFRDGDAFLGSQQEYMTGYTSQLSFINDQILSVFKEILANSRTPPIIVLQGDHGSGLHLDYEAIENTDTHERMSILNAIYSGDREIEQFYESMTPVNTFRVILNSVFMTDLDLLPDLCYYSTWEAPFQFIPVPTD